MMKSFLFPGQGSQFPGMGKELYEKYPEAQKIFDKANEILGFSLTKIIFEGGQEELKQTSVTQPAIFTHSLVMVKLLDDKFAPEMVAGHSLGEFSALVASKCLSFEDGLEIVKERAMAMQDACEENPSSMAAVLGLDDNKVEEICDSIKRIVVCANYNCPGQIVISGENEAVDEACVILKEAGARRALKLPVGGAFHSPLMSSAKKRLEKVITEKEFRTPICPVYQNIDAKPHTDVEKIQQNIIDQLDNPVLWTKTIQNMISSGATNFFEVGPGKVLTGLVNKINREVSSVKLDI